MRAETFRQLHQSGCFVIPNPWDVGSARALESLGFPALATTSAGFAFSRGLPDGAVPRETVLAHLREVVAAMSVPINADFESGFAADAEGVAESVRLAVATGVAGLSIEDSKGEELRPLPEAIERLRAARRASREAVLTARAECFLLGVRDPLRESLRRLEAYAAEGADCLYAPGLRTPDEVAAVVKTVAPKAVNVLVSSPAFTVAQLRDLGVRRISVGGALARAAWSGFYRAAREIASGGTFESLGEATPHRELDAFFRQFTSQ